ncbi:SIR2 family protein [Azospirillum formosense]|uniref:SIR2 family protein n=1 Tax=Azospirillum formosense TaxID=861533 RepID=A0ABX2L4S4_9PROT|nr:SIR2 family protein [Azospirillum formosense]MBY3756014.1 SIR2 family protein [Azospirillum formosense]NUB22962.1 SIR2 family protein [Azospirillum formosense]
MAKYLKHFPKPLLDDLVAGRWLPVVGAGMSLNAKVAPPARMPLWPDLGTALSGELTDYSSAGTLDAISAYQHEYGRAKLIERLTELLLVKEAEPGEAHHAFCSIPFDVVCTTNFDFLLERQYDAIPRYVYPIIDEEQLSINGYTAGTQLLKLHGDLRHPSRLVATEEDYDGFLARYPLISTYLANLLIKNTAVFIGYSLDDPDFRQIWTIVSDRLGRSRRMAYSIMVDASSSDIARFERRGVKVINLPGQKSRYGSILSEAFVELREHIRDNVISISKVTEEEPLQELSLPRDATTRLCFFSLPIEMLSLYRSRVFPVVEEIGFVPVTADDVISPGQNISAKIDALVDRSSVVVVEMASPWTRAEYDIAVARNRNASANRERGALPIIVVASEQSQVPSSAQIYPIVHRNGVSDEAFESFINDLSQHLTMIAGETKQSRDREAQRLLAAHEYPAAVISAITQLEAKLYQLISSKAVDISSTNYRRPVSLRALIDAALREGLIDGREYNLIRGWITVRNMAIHEAAPVGGKIARDIVEGVARIIRRLNG